MPVSAPSCDHERNHHAGWKGWAADDDPDIPDLFVHPLAECSDVAFPEQGRRVAMYENERIAKYDDPGRRLFFRRLCRCRICRHRLLCRGRFLSESRRRGGEQDAGADQTPERHGLAWNTARSSPSLNSSSIGPSMS